MKAPLHRARDLFADHLAARADEALEAAEADGRARRAESIDEAAAIEEKVRARGPRSPDADPDDLPARARAFLDATDDAARDAIARIAPRGAREPRTALDALVV